MSCCGNKRSQFYGAGAAHPVGNPNAHLGQDQVPSARLAAPTPVLFEYVGMTGLSAMGPVTQKLYRFDAKHARVAVDPRDAAAIAGVPNLKRVR